MTAEHEQEHAALSVLHTCHRVADLERALAFYGLLGFREHSRPSAGNAFLGLPDDGDRLQLTQVADGPPAVDYGHIAVAVADLEAMLARLAEHGVGPEDAPRRAGTLRLCFVRDPDGYLVELIEDSSTSAR